MQELIKASMWRMAGGGWRVSVRFAGSFVERSFPSERIAWEYVRGWLPLEDDDETQS